MAGAATLAVRAEYPARVVSARCVEGRSTTEEAGRTTGARKEPVGVNEVALGVGLKAAPHVVPTAAKAIRMLNDARQGICNCGGL